MPDNDASQLPDESLDPLGGPDPLEALELAGVEVVAAGWMNGLLDFRLELGDGRSLVFHDCLQASLFRPISSRPPLTIGSWWADEPSPVLLSLDPRVRFLYRHHVMEIGDGLLRVAYRQFELDPGVGT